MARRATAARKAPAGRRARQAGAHAASAATDTWYDVVASRESEGGIGACRPIEPRGYSELSTNPEAGAGWDFAALGKLPCLTGLYLHSFETGKTVGAVKQDVGRGSSFHPHMGLYPQTVRDLGMDPNAGEYHVLIRRQDGKPMHVPGALATQLPAPTGQTSTPAQAGASYFNPLGHARVTPERIDQGVDYAGTGYLVAIADGIVTESVANGSGWEDEGYLEYRITQPGELEGAYIFYAEGIDPVVRKGERVRGGARVANLRVPMPHGIELGFAAGVGEESYFAYHDGSYSPYDAENAATRPGIAFSNLIEKLGGPPGKREGPVVGKFPEYMQSGEPAPLVNPATYTPTQNPTGGGIAASGQFDWPSSVLSAFVQLQRGSGNASHHSHAAWLYARGITYVAKSD